MFGERSLPNRGTLDFPLGVKSPGLGFCEWVLTVLAFLLVVMTFPISVWFCMKVRTAVKPL